MKRTTATGHNSNLFVDAVPNVYAGTVLSAEDLNQHQEEIARAIEPWTPLTGTRRDQLKQVRQAQAVLSAVGSARIAADSGVMGSAARTHFAINALGTRIVAAGDSGTADYSDDFGLSWNAITLGSGSTENAKFVTYDSALALWLLCGGDIQTSANATAWTRRVSPSGSIVWRHIVRRGGTLYAFGSDGSNGYIRTSTDGTTWSAASTITGKRFAGFVADNGSRFVAGDLAGASIFYSDDAGVNWSSASAGTSNPFDCFYDTNSAYFYAVGVGSSGYVFYSAAGASWLSSYVGNTVAACMTPGGLLVWHGGGGGGSATNQLSVWQYNQPISGWAPVLPSTSRRACLLQRNLAACVVFSDGSSTKWVQSPLFVA